jgi:opacity protein-like surface antigen
LDLFESVLAVRVLFPLGTEAIKLYAEGSAGVANLSVSGETSARAEIGGREFSFNRRLDADAWVFAWGLAAGVQFDFTGNFGLRAGYEFHGLGDADMFDLKSSTGNMHGVSAALLLKF